MNLDNCASKFPILNKIFLKMIGNVKQNACREIPRGKNVFHANEQLYKYVK
jgi:hypothetical protein